VTAIDGSETRSASAARRRAAPRTTMTPRQYRTRANLSALLVCADLAMAAMIAHHVHGTARALGGLAFCVVVPGWAIVGPLRLNRAPLELGLVVASGLCALTVVAQLAITFGEWRFTFLQLLVCGLCLPTLLWQSLVRRPPKAER
jgi:uncharacterized membrane protein